MTKNANHIRRCIVHIGSEKTGTTSLQHFCARNRAWLRGQGFCYPRSLAYADERLHRKFSDLGRGRGEHDHLEMAEVLRKECSEAAAGGAHTVVISSEFLHSRLRYPANVARIRKFLAPFFDDIKIVYYARRQDLLLVSMHSTGIRGGFTTDASALSIYEKKGRHYFDHLQICDLWAGEFGNDNIICRIYERSRLSNGDIIDDFAKLIGLERDAAHTSSAANESLSFETMSALLFLNKSDRKDDRDLRRKLMVKGKKRGGVRVPMLTKADAQSFFDRFRDSNCEFFAKYVDKTLATEFSRDFSGFPDAIPVMTDEEIEAFIHE